MERRRKMNSWRDEWRGSIHRTTITGLSVVACQSLPRTKEPKNQIPQVHRHLHAFGNGKFAPLDAMRVHGWSGCMAPHVNLGTGDVWSASRPTRLNSPLIGSHCIVGWISSRASLDASEQRKIYYHCRESNHVAFSAVTQPTELSGSPPDGVNRKSWEAVTQCPAPHRTTALCSEISHGGTLSSGVLTDTHSVTCSTLQQDALAPVRGDAARPLFAKRGLVSHLQKTERIHVFQRTAHSFPNTLQFYEHHWPRCSSTADKKPPVHSWQQCRHYISHIHRLFRHTFNIFLYFPHQNSVWSTPDGCSHIQY